MKNCLTKVFLLSLFLFFASGIVPQDAVVPALFIAVLLFLLLDLLLSPSARTKGLILLSSTCITITAGDLVLRISIGDRIFPRPQALLFEHHPGYIGAFRYKPNSTVTMSSIGDLAEISCLRLLVQRRQVHFSTDEFGFRNNERDAEKSVDIVLLGDSFVVGTGTSQEQIWASLISSADTRQVVNLGIPSGPKQQAAILARELPRLRLNPQSTLVWMIFEGNDLIDESRPDLPIVFERTSTFQEYFRIYSNFYNDSPSQLLLRSLINPCRNSFAVEKLTIPQRGDALFYKLHSSHRLSSNQLQSYRGWKNMRNAISRVAQIAKEKDMKVLIALAPSKRQVYLTKPGYAPSALSEALQKEVNSLGFDFIDLLKPLKAADSPSNEILYWRDDSHWNPEGHRVVALAIMDKLRD